MKFISAFFLILTLVSASLSQAGEREKSAWKMIEDGALVVDVRTDQEFAGGHLEEAILIPYQEIVDQFERLEIRKDRAVVLYCRSGQRASVAERALRDAGYTNLFNGGGYHMLINQPR